MEGFLRSSFLLRLVSFLLLPFKITGQAGVVQRVNRGYRVMTALLALVFCLVFVYIHILYKLCMCVTMCIYSIYPSCVSLFCFCVNWIRVTDVAQSDWKHTDTSVDELPPTSPLLPSPPPLPHPPPSVHSFKNLQIRTSVFLHCMLLSDHSPHSPSQTKPP